ncbi:hypothetical protein C0993_008281 [Termitomyces sp. T159_Od127]|nr:hypothetical protein C0993_008281 [Termitomyces sp. T159_Od127]
MTVPTTTLDVDPLAKVLEPPPDETPAEREARLVAEAQAKRISEQIDEEIEKEKAAEKKVAKALKMLLLGQSESGKSTTIKNLQLLYDPETFRKERASWKAVIQLNIVRSVHVILEAIMQERSDVESPDYTPVQTDLLKLKMRLAPLLQVEQALIQRLTPEGSTETEATLHEASYADRSKNLLREIAINSTRAWKETLCRPSRSDQQNEKASEAHDSGDPSIVLNACAQDIQILWNDSLVRTLLKEHNIHMEEVAGL